MERPKVFGIGFHKTGTKSLRNALKTLGYRVTGPNGYRLPDIAARYEEMCRALSQDYDAFQDNPWPLVFRQMSVMWPDAKFVLTLRPPEQWIVSIKRHFGEGSTPMRELVYEAGCPVGHETLYIDRLQRHEAEVREFFADQPERLLVLRITQGEGYEKLCPFLGLPIPDTPFPWANKATGGPHLGASQPRA